LLAAGELRAERGDANSARPPIEEAVLISRTIATRDPGDVSAGLQLVDHLNFLVEIYGRLGDMGGAVKLLQEALDTCNALSQQYPGNAALKRRVAGSLANLARQRLNEARAVIAELRAGDPDNRQYASDADVFDQVLIALDRRSKGEKGPG
jgi:hypothetical protein